MRHHPDTYHERIRIAAEWVYADPDRATTIRVLAIGDGTEDRYRVERIDSTPRTASAYLRTILAEHTGEGAYIRCWDTARGVHLAIARGIEAVIHG